MHSCSSDFKESQSIKDIEDEDPDISASDRSEVKDKVKLLKTQSYLKSAEVSIADSENVGT